MYDVFVFTVLINDDPFYAICKASVRFPYWLFSHFPAQDFLCRIFQSCIFTSCILVPHFPVSHFPALQFCAVFSIPAFSSPAFFLVPHFHVSYFQSPPFINDWLSIRSVSVTSLRTAVWAGLRNPNHGEGEAVGAGMVPFERALVSSYGPSIVSYFSSIFTRFRDVAAFVRQHATYHPTSSLTKISPCYPGSR